MGMTFLGRYDRELALNAPGWTVDGLLEMHPEIRNVVSLGPNAAINETRLALRNPKIAFTLIDQDEDMMAASMTGSWAPEDINWHGISIQERRKRIKEAGMEGILVATHDKIERLIRPENLHHIIGSYPLTDLQETFDLCIASNALPCCIGGTEETVWRWVLHDLLRENGVFLNEWGIFQKGRGRIYRVEHTGVLQETDHAVLALNTL